MSKHLDPIRLVDRRNYTGRTHAPTVDVVARMRELRQTDTKKMLDRYRASVIN